MHDDVRQLWASVERDFGAAGFDAFQRLTMLRLIESFEQRCAPRRYSKSVLDRFSISFGRIVNSVSDQTFERYRNVNDILLKDLGLCRQKIFPAGAQVVEPDSTFHRSLLYRGGLKQALRFAGLLLSSGGHSHWYQIHTHLSELEDFNPEGWDDCYVRIADMLALNPQIRGMWGGSWFYDPALEKVSPRLAYLRKIPQENGALVLYSNVDIKGGALSKSAARKKAYESGEYLPKSYSLIWPRKPMMAWADRKRAQVSR